MSDAAHDWLPGLLEFSGDWSSYVEEVYDAFSRDLLASPTRFRGRRVAVRRDPRDQGKEAGFWHAISEGPEEQERTPDLRRCERVRWIRALIECSDRKKVRIWGVMRGSDRRVLIALKDFTYVVVLAVRKKYVLFITAYAVWQRHRREKLRRECQAWNDAQKG